MKENCWEAKQCGRQPGGAKESELGICPAAIASNINGLNGGTNGGRACWAIEKTLCGSTIQGTFSARWNGCMKCDFYATVRNEEKENLIETQQIILKLCDPPRYVRQEPRYVRQKSEISRLIKSY